MAKRSQNVVNEERSYLFSELFFSTTDLSGRITSWNDVFARISGYSPEELLGKPHSLIRHPDMPRGVFQLLWDRITNGETVGAYVKNLAKDGKYYWVYALVIPINEGFLSIRLKPSSSLLGVVMGEYASLLDFEEKLIASGKPKAEVAVLSKEKLLADLKSLGIEDYFAFMKTSLPAEILGREDKLKENSTKSADENSEDLCTKNLSPELADIQKIESDLNKLFKDLSKSLSLASNVESKFKETQQLADEIKRGALNATIEASRLGTSGDTLFVLANYLDTNSSKTIDEIAKAQSICQKSLSKVTEILFKVCAAKLQTETLSNFMLDLKGTQNSAIVMPVDRFATLVFCFRQGIEEMANSYHGIEEAFSTVLVVLEEIRLLFVSLKVAHVSAKTEARRIKNAGRFGSIFEEISSVVDFAKETIDKVSQEIVGYIATLKTREYSCQSLLKNAKKIKS